MHDGEIHYWTQIWQANNLGGCGILLSTFLKNPEATLKAIMFRKDWPDRGDEAHYPLLPAQKRVAERLLREHEEEVYWRELLESFEQGTAFPPVNGRNGSMVERIPEKKLHRRLLPWRRRSAS